jgi:hypothetical protein
MILDPLFVDTAMHLSPSAASLCDKVAWSPESTGQRAAAGADMGAYALCKQLTQALTGYYRERKDSTATGPVQYPFAPSAGITFSVVLAE